MDVDVLWRVRRGDFVVVQGQHVVVAPLGYVEQCSVPPDVATKWVAVIPRVGWVIEPRNTFSRAALGFEHMGYRVDCPQLVGVSFNSLSTNRLGPEVVARFFKRERMHPQQACVPRQRVVPCRKDA